MRVCLFTDTLGDVNGVSRFIRSMAEQAELAGRELFVASSTRFEIPTRGNLENFRPIVATRMPRYENLELAWPPARRMSAWARRLRPDAVHISTPGPVGLVGRKVARRLGLPMLGVYHTDFPAYIGHLFDDRALSWTAGAFMRWFYRPFARVVTRSRGYAGTLTELGIEPQCIVPLSPGIDLETFHTRHRHEQTWARLGVPQGVKVLYVGRVSVEKGLPVLAKAWRALAARERNARPDHTAAHPHSPAPSLVIVGDGPYRAQMERDLAGTGAVFLGFRHGPELSTIYASSDMFVFPSTTDTLGQVVMEAQSSGLPALVTDQGGPKEVVRDRHTGLVLPADDPRAWAAAMSALIHDPAQRQRMSAAAHASMSGLSIAASFNHFWSIHEQAVSKPHAKPRAIEVRFGTSML